MNLLLVAEQMMTTRENVDYGIPGITTDNMIKTFKCVPDHLIIFLLIHTSTLCYYWKRHLCLFSTLQHFFPSPLSLFMTLLLKKQFKNHDSISSSHHYILHILDISTPVVNLQSCYKGETVLSNLRSTLPLKPWIPFFLTNFRPLLLQ